MLRARKPLFRSGWPSSPLDQAVIGDHILASLSPTPSMDRQRESNLRSLVAKFLAEDVTREDPPVQTLHRVGDRWSSLILIILECGTFRHSELHRIIDLLCAKSSSKSISQRILTQKLRMLERDGMLTRTVWPTVPPRTQYALTPLGQELAQWVGGLVRWCNDNGAAITAAQKNYDSKQ